MLVGKVIENLMELYLFVNCELGWCLICKCLLLVEG